jgi:Tat protein secretion system quality control protein TatD with DNase activity
MNEPKQQSMAAVIQEAEKTVPDLLTWIADKTGNNALVAIAILETVSNVIVDAGVHAIGAEQLEKFLQQVEQVKVQARHWKVRS